MPDEAVIIEDKKIEVTKTPFDEGVWKTADQITATKADETIVDDKKTGTSIDTKIEDKKVEDKIIDTKVDDKVIDDKKIEFRPEPIKFANETSEKIFNLLKDGKEDEVAKHYEEKYKLQSVDGADAIKMQLANEHKGFTPEEVTDLFNEKYNIPEKPEQFTTELDTDFEQREAKFKEDISKIEKRIARDAKIAKTELNKLAQELVLPDIPKLEIKAPEPTQEELDAQKAKHDKYLQSVGEGLKNLNGYQATYKDEEVEIPIAYPITEDEKKALQPIIEAAGTDAQAFLQKIGWVDDKGNLMTQKIAEDVHLITNKESVLNKMVSETGNKRYAEVKKANKNIDFTGNKRSGTLDAAPREKEEKMVGHFFGS